MNIDPEPVKVGCWFADCQMRERPRWDGVVEVIFPHPARAAFCAENYRDQIWKAAKRQYPNIRGLLLRPEKVADAAELRTWCYKSGLSSAQSMAANSAVWQALSDAADAIVMARWSNTAAGAQQ
jgi:hypothetical protein